MTTGPQLLFASVHRGPYLSLQPLEAELGGERIHYLAEGVARQQRANDGLPYLDAGYLERESGALENLIKEKGIKAVVRGASVAVDEPCQVNTETLAAAAAERLGIPVIAVEDFPGNYRMGPDERLDCLCVGEDSSIRLHRDRGVDRAVILNAGNPRYGELRNNNREELRASTRAALGLASGPVLLWAGQPDGENSYLALERLLRCFGETPATLLFRAHPRDSAYVSGKYEKQLSEAPLRVLDVTSYHDATGLCCASDLVATQFSSLAVEASYLGVPALFVLYDDLGKDFLRSLYGYDTLPWCADQCSFVIENDGEAQEILETALFDESARNQVRANFQNHFASYGNSARVIADRVLALAGSAPKNGSGIE